MKWLVASKPIATIAYGDLLKLKSAFTYNARITMPFADVYDDKWAEKRKTDYFPEDLSKNPTLKVDEHAPAEYDPHAPAEDNNHAPAEDSGHSAPAPVEDTAHAPADNSGHSAPAHH